MFLGAEHNKWERKWKCVLVIKDYESGLGIREAMSTARRKLLPSTGKPGEYFGSGILLWCGVLWVGVASLKLYWWVFTVVLAPNKGCSCVCKSIGFTNCWVCRCSQEHLSCFHIMAVVKAAEMNMEVQSFLQHTDFNFFGFIPVIEIVTSCDNSSFSFTEELSYFPKWLYQFVA